MESYIEELFTILKPIEDNLDQLTTSIPYSSDEIVAHRLHTIRQQTILSIFSIYDGSALNFVKQDVGNSLTYKIYWMNRVKYFKNNKKEILILLNKIIRILHQTDKMNIIDIRLNKETKQVKLLIETEKIEVSKQEL